MLIDLSAERGVGRLCWMAGLLLSTVLSTACSKPLEVQVVTPAQRELQAVVFSVTSGTVRAEEMAELAFGDVGRVQRLHVNLGDRVEKGATLAEIENEDLLIALENARTDYRRARDLRQKGVFSDTELERARREFQRFQAAYNKTIIVAPFDGMIVELNLEVGQLSQITAIIPEPLVRIVDEGVRYIRADMDELDLAQLRVGQEVRVSIPAFSSATIDGRIRTIVPYVSSVRDQERTCEIEVEILNSELARRLPVGASADLEVIVETRESVLAVPTLALLGTRAARYVFVLDGDTLSERPVEVGIRTFEYAEILEGLSEVDRVVLPPPGVQLAQGMRVRERA